MSAPIVSLWEWCSLWGFRIVYIHSRQWFRPLGVIYNPSAESIPIFIIASVVIVHFNDNECKKRFVWLLFRIKLEDKKKVDGTEGDNNGQKFLKTKLCPPLSNSEPCLWFVFSQRVTIPSRLLDVNVNDLPSTPVHLRPSCTALPLPPPPLPPSPPETNDMALD